MPHFVLFVGDLAVLNAPRHSEVLFSVPKRKMAVKCLLEKVCVGEASSGLSCSAVGPEFMLMNQQSRHPSFYCPSQIPRLANRRPVAALRPTKGSWVEAS